MARLLRDYPEQVLMGRDEDGEDYYMARPQWDCGWYWGFGRLDMYDRNGVFAGWTHLDTLGRHGAKHTLGNLYDVLTAVLGTSEGGVRDMGKRGTLWTFCDAIKTIYTLRDTAEVLGRGGSHYSASPAFKDVVINLPEVDRINNVVIPMLIDAMYVFLGVVEPVSSDVLFELLEEAKDEN